MFDAIGGATAHAAAGESTSVLVEVLERLARIELLVSQPRHAGEKIDEFADIDPERFYSVTELSRMPGRPVSKQALYSALDLGRLVEQKTGGPRGCMGRSYIAWLRSRRPAQSRRGRPSKMLAPAKPATRAR